MTLEFLSAEYKIIMLNVFKEKNVKWQEQDIIKKKINKRVFFKNQREVLEMNDEII